MGQFKPMVKMMTTEPTVELKLKKGGAVAGHKCMKTGGKAEENGHKAMADGGMSGEMMGRGMSPKMMGAPMVAPRGRRAAPPMGRPSMAARRAAMKAAQMGARGGMKSGGAMEALKEHAGKPASKAHKGLKTGGVVKGNGGGYKTGGVVMGQGGYKDGGIIMSKKDTSTISTAKVDRSPAKTGDVKLGNGGGYKKGGLAACGASAKKYASGGSVNDAGKAEKMPAKKKSPPVAINMLSGTFKKGGKVSSKELQAIFKKENAPAMKAAKADSNEKYKKGGYAGGGSMSDREASPEEQLREMRRQRAETKGYESVAKADEEANEQMLDMITSLPRSVKNLYRKAKNALTSPGAVTDTERTVSRTVAPAKKSGGRC